ncbi:VOC family protein [Nesterenkonia flava]|uniref:VOC family protein n=1 Tax=Nesterenkonia flava TaxID=469799 RepID=A0ABU1FXM0_9MICC|nr:VOC family protein [Nesterenkonia flava]MDR5713087.1 VOC family protein [Nesterenkonia flava]
MALVTTTHLNFPGTARQALSFYQQVFGGELTASTYGELGAPADCPHAEKIVFGLLESQNGFRVMAYDVPGLSEKTPGSTFAGNTQRTREGTVTDSPFFLSVRGESLEEVTAFWNGLSEGASVIEPLAASPWSPGFGMLTDRFGVTWVVDVAHHQ